MAESFVFLIYLTRYAILAVIVESDLEAGHKALEGQRILGTRCTDPLHCCDLGLDLRSALMACAYIVGILKTELIAKGIGIVAGGELPQFHLVGKRQTVGICVEGSLKALQVMCPSEALQINLATESGDTFSII